MNTDPLNIENQEIKPKISKREQKLIKKIKTMKIQHEKEKRNYILLLNRYRFRLNYLKRKISTLTGEISNEAEKTKNEDKKQLFDRLLSAEITQKFAKTANRKDKRVITKLIDKEKFKKFKVATDLRKVHLRERFKKNARNNINIQKLVEKFYEDDINSRITPGKKQYKKKHGIVKQVRYLLDSIKNLHKKFLAENTNIKISYTTFTRLRPFWVSLPTDDRDTCACLLHTNFNLLIAALNKNNILHVKDSHNLIKEICCDKYRLDCLNRKCASCKNKTVPYKEFRNDKEIQYMVWERDTKKVDTKEIKIIKKKTKRSDPRNLIIELENMLPKFLSHTSNIVNQYATVKCLKESLTTNEALVHMDFSENYSYKYSEEVQSMHFGGSRGQVSLHTAVVYLKNDSNATQSYSVCTASECTRHDAAAVWAHLNYLIKFVFNRSSQINRIHILTDSPTSQYRNKYIFYILTQLRNDFPDLNLVTWNYQEAGHGKGAPDGIGAVIKRTADYELKCHQDVGDFDAFVNIIRRNIKNVEMGIIQEHEIKLRELMLPKDIATFKGTMTVHQVIWAADSAYLEFRKQSCFECISVACKHGKHMRFFKIYNTPIGSTMENVKVIPENKRIKVLSDVTIRYANTDDPMLHDSTPSTSSLRSIRHSWANKCFINNYTKATDHEKEFLDFLKKCEDDDDDPLSD
ncbi:hypothetical protein HW555_011412 [Spodoptera exigua]|uniref:Uncharacterized protein n=1 Tax=Spodoptera exigua TaxID=7107 RepID=A0A835G8L3_SPOEX|nr:hypothetical protein HW555_011412 [Spodoptera exigua]